MYFDIFDISITKLNQSKHMKTVKSGTLFNTCLTLGSLLVVWRVKVFSYQIPLENDHLLNFEFTLKHSCDVTHG